MDRREYTMEFLLNARTGSGYSKAFQEAQSKIRDMQTEISALSKTQSDISAYQKQQTSIENTRKRLELLQKQYNNIQEEIEKTGNASSDLKNKLLSKQQQIDKTTNSLNRQTQKLDDLGNKLQEAGVDMDDLGHSSEKLADRIDEIKREQEEAAESAETFGDRASQAFSAVHDAIVAAGIAAALTEVYQYFADCAQASMDFESAMTGVAKTTDLTDEELSTISGTIKQMSTEIPATTEEIAGIAEAAGQLGIHKESLLDFTETMAMLGTATNMTAEEAATNLSQLANITGMSQDNFDRLGATIVDLGNNLATTEKNIVDMSMRIAGAGAQVGMTEPQIMAFSGALSSVGIAADAGGSAFSTLISNMSLEVQKGGEGLEQFADVAGMTAAEFKTAFEQDAAGAIMQFIQGLGSLDAQGKSAIAVLSDMGLTEIRMRDALLRAAGASDVFTNALAIGNNAWNENTALTNEASKRYATTQSQLIMMQNAYKNLTVAIGDAYNPVLREAFSLGTEALGVVTEYVEENPAVVNAVTSFASVMGLVTAGLAAYTIGAKVAKIATTALTSTIPGVNVIMGISLAVAGITAAVSGLATAAYDEAVPSVDELTQASQGLQEAMDEASATYDDTVSSTMAAADVADSYIEKLKELEAAGVDTEEEHKEYHNTLSLLCQVVPELAEYIDLETDTIKGGTDALDANTEAWKRNAIQQAQQERMTALYKQYSDVLIEVKKNEVALQQAKDERSIAETRFNKISKETTKILLDGGELTDEQTRELNEASNAWLQAGSTVQAYQEAIDEGNAALAAAEEEFGVTEKAIEAMNEELLGSTDVTGEATEQAKNLQEAVSAVMEEAKALSDAYKEAYDAAYESVSGQYSLWDEAAEVVATSAETINSALESQTSYWQNYNANLQSLSERGKDIEGLSDMIASFADGSADSVNAVAGMATASDEDLAAMVANWQSLQEEQSATADSIAELRTNFSDAMDLLQEDLAEDIAGMDLSEQAAASGKATIEGYISALDDMLPSVAAAYNRISDSAISAMGGHVQSPGTPSGYADGTANASRGWHWVGEEGPELMYMGGGETVLPADVSARALETMQPVNAPAGNSVQVVFQISGDVTSEGAERLREYGDEFAERVMEVVSSNQSDQSRRVYQ